MTDIAPPLVLIVDDEPLIQDLVAEALTEGGFGVHHARDGQEAIELLNGAQTFRALVTDINLGRGPTGWDVARCARELHPDLPVIYVSGGNPQDWAALGVPVSTMITKPFAPAQIVTAVAALLNNGS